MPALLSVTAATMPAMAVPWPLGSLCGIGALDDGPAGQDLPGEVRMRGVDTGVEDRDDRGAGRVDDPVGLVPVDLAEVPLVVPAVVGRDGLGLVLTVALDELDARDVAQGIALGGRARDDAHVQDRDAVHERDAGVIEDGQLVVGRDALGEGHDEVADRARVGGRLGLGLGARLGRWLEAGL